MCTTPLYCQLKNDISYLVRFLFFVVVVETPFYLQAVYVHSANWCEDWVLWLGEGHSVVPFHSY
jgi:hypothetical protein